ncbi:reverse transcriptase domain-containing protein [Tanacetum coccineum]
MHEGYLFKSSSLCIPVSSLRKSIILERDVRGLAGHFGHDKTLALLRDRFYWLRMEKDIHRVIERCRIFHITKTHGSNVGLYTHLPVLEAPWEDIDKHNKQYADRAYKHRKHIFFHEGDLVWIHLRKERFSTRCFGKLKPRADGPFSVLKKTNDNAYKIELSGHYNISAIFNVADLSPCVGDYEDKVDSKSSLSQGGKGDVGSA